MTIKNFNKSNVTHFWLNISNIEIYPNVLNILAADLVPKVKLTMTYRKTIIVQLLVGLSFAY